MTLRRWLSVSAFGALTLWCSAGQTSAQVAPSPQGQIILSELSPPIYPPLARTARVLGDVKIAVRVRQDGAVESAEVVSGHPLLRAAALDSARRSKFECHECREELTSDSILYTFGFTTTQHCCQPQESSSAAEQGTKEPRVGITQSQNHITILTEPFCICDPGADIIKVRSAKCLFLWHCSKRYGL
jgi:TonB family protein